MAEIENDLPYCGLPNGAAPPIGRAGHVAGQRRLSAAAWGMIEVWTTPDETACSRLSRTWLSGQGWRVLLVPHFGYQGLDALEARIAASIPARGAGFVFGANLDPGVERLSAVFRVPLNPMRRAEPCCRNTGKPWLRIANPMG